MKMKIYSQAQVVVGTAPLSQVKYYGPSGEGAEEGLKDGDVLVSNHPQLAGGSHLPDITVITPVFSHGEIVFFVASRGHHADIGGISPGSMPPHSKSLLDEGASIVSFKLVQDGIFNVGPGIPVEFFCCVFRRGIPVSSRDKVLSISGMQSGLGAVY